jgi:hypothetical protein
MSVKKINANKAKKVFTSDQPILPNIQGLSNRITSLEDFNDAQQQWAMLRLSVNQTTNLLVNDHIQFDTLQKSGDFVPYQDDLSTIANWDVDSGQDLGIVQLKFGNTYKFISINGATGTNGYIGLGVYDRTNSQYISLKDRNDATIIDAELALPKSVLGVYTPNTDIKIELRIHAISGVTTIYAENTGFLIEQIRNED